MQSPAVQTCLIVNPAAGRGRSRHLLPEIETAFRERLELVSVYYTSAAGDEAELATSAVASGTTTVVAIGGDGTCSRIADAIIRSNHRCSLAVVPCGTGNDFAKTIGVTELKATAIADLVLRNTPIRIDVGRADGHHFLNSCGFGFDPAVLAASNNVRFLKGDAVYIYSALGQLFSYRGIEVSTDSMAGISRASMLMVTVSNGKSLGGAFQIAPHASVVDGMLDVCFFSDADILNRMRLFAAALRGKHIGMPGVTTRALARLSLSFATNPSIEMDGELLVARDRTLDIECLPRALSVIAAPGSAS